VQGQRQEKVGNVQITVQVDDGKLEALVKQRVDELFSQDARYRDTGVRELVVRIVDEAAVSAVKQARDALAAELPALAAKAVRLAAEGDIIKAAKRGMNTLRKLYAGFDPAKLTPEQRAWLEKQITKAADQRENEVLSAIHK